LPELVDLLRQALAEKYAIDREIGSGAMSRVYLARDLRHNRAVALKVLRPELSAVLGADRFLREISIAAKLHHPHILPLYDSGDARGLLFFVMPYVEGETLRGRLAREGRLPLDVALQILREVADALTYAHGQGIVHRDVKPENVLFEAGHAVVSDFGIARAVSVSEHEALTGAGLILGTPAYMSPEQADGTTAIDARSDVYALGCVLYEMLAGRPPFTGSFERILYQHLSETPADLSRERPTVPGRLNAVVAAALAKQPSERFETAAALAAAAAEAAATPARTPASSEQSIAVLPFANMSADPENECFSDGMTEEIISTLAQVSDLHVASRTSSFAFKRQALDIADVGRRLNVGTVLEGSVRRAGSRIRVTAQLVKVSDGYHLWSERYDRELDDVFAIQEEIAQAIVSKLRAELLEGAAQPLVRKATQDVEAYTLYLKGRFYWNRRNEGALERGVECFEQALAIDPGFTLASVGLADSHNIFGFYCLRPPQDAFPKATAAASRAVELEPGLAEAHAALGYAQLYYDWDWDAAEASFRRAIACDPGYAMAHHYLGNHLVAMGRMAPGKAAFREALRLEPLSLIVNAGLGWAMYYAREYGDAVRQLQSTLEIDASFGLAHLWLGWSYEQLGRAEKALDAYQRAHIHLGGAPLATAAIARAQARLGNRSRAAGTVLDLEAETERYVSPYDLASVYATLGHREETFTWLERAFTGRSHLLVFLHVDPKFDSVRADSRFEEMVARVGVPPIPEDAA
jgi:serine/threonine protein kinase